MTFRRTKIVPALMLMLAGCASVSEPTCGTGAKRSVNELLYFGTAKPRGTVTLDDWTQFLNSSVTPRFPQGLTVWQASGQWQGADGAIVREASFVLNLLHPDDEWSENAIQAITADYKSRFQQETVLRVKSYACVSF